MNPSRGQEDNATATQRWESEGGATSAPPSKTEADGGVERVRARAYEIFESRSAKGDPGDEQSDWLKAERELCHPDENRQSPKRVGRNPAG